VLGDPHLTDIDGRVSVAIVDGAAGIAAPLANADRCGGGRR